jgi:hypothetical protein
MSQVGCESGGSAGAAERLWMWLMVLRCGGPLPGAVGTLGSSARSPVPYRLVTGAVGLGTVAPRLAGGVPHAGRRP